MKARKARPARAHSVRDAAGALLLHPREDVQMFHVKHRGASAQLAASLNGKKASNSEEISRLDRVRRKAARKSTLTNRRYAQGGLSFCPCDPRGRFRIRCLFAIRCPIGLHEGRNARCQESAIENQASPTRGNASVLTKQRGRMQVASGRTLQPLEQDAAYASAMPRLKSMIF